MKWNGNSRKNDEHLRSSSAQQVTAVLRCLAQKGSNCLPASPSSLPLPAQRTHIPHWIISQFCPMCLWFFFQTSNCLKIIMLGLRFFNRIPRMYIRYLAGLTLQCYDTSQIHSEISLLCVLASCSFQLPLKNLSLGGGTQLGNLPAHSLVLCPITWT